MECNLFELFFFNTNMHTRFLPVCLWIDSSFLFSANTVSRFTTVYLSFKLLKNILVASKFWQLWIKLLQTSVYRFLSGNKFLAPLGQKSASAAVLDNMVRNLSLF